jgi:uncharacterized protein with ParB-like and HNH nuclease domain
MSITPQNRDIMQLFSGNIQYFLDFYQRDYQWKKVHILKLLEDIFYRFSLEYKPSLDVTVEAVSQFDWYYLSTFVTNEFKGKIFIVDGQQRLTSLTLILIKLYHLAKKHNSERIELLENQIRGVGLYGQTFWMGYGNRAEILRDLFENGCQSFESSQYDLSQRNLYENYKTIDKQMDEFITDPHKLDAFILYFLTRVQLVNIQIQDTKDVPMVFEVINDRGERLRPYEVLKGKLLGQIDKDEIDAYFDVWQKCIHQIQEIDENEVDNFFRFYFRSRFVETLSDWREFDGEYHKAIYEEKWDKKIHFKRNVQKVKEFIKNDLEYYSNIYVRILKESKQYLKTPWIYFNALNDQDRQSVLLLSALQVKDPYEVEKLATVSKLFDRHYSMLQLTSSYNSNDFTETISYLNTAIRGKDLSEIQKIFDERLLADMSDIKGVKVLDSFDWTYFSAAGRLNLPYKFIKYFFARIDHFIAKEISKNAISYNDIVLKTGPKTGYQIEHILANNDDNLTLFGGDEEKFNVERNRLGGLLLLLGEDNNLSRNEPYLDKLKIYTSRELYWNKSLSKEFHHKNAQFEEFATRYDLDFKLYENFDDKSVIERQKILFHIAKHIWFS